MSAGNAGVDRAWPTTSSTSPTTPPPTVSLAYVESVGDGRAFYDVGPPHAPTVSRSCCCRAGPPSGGSRAAASHTGSLASDAAGVRRDVPPGRGLAGRHRRGGVRGRGHVRHPAAARGPERRGGHHRRRLGRAHRRRDRPLRADAARRCPTTSAPRSTPSSRRAGAATTRSTSRGPRRATPSPQVLELVAAPRRGRRGDLPRHRASSRTRRA